MVPLVAMDELPSTISIRGVPRILSPHDIYGMTGVGNFDSRHRQYIVDSLNKGFETPTPPGRSLMCSSFAGPATRPLGNDALWGMNRSSVFTTPPKAYGIQEQSPNSLKAPFSNMAPSTLEPTAPAAESELPPFRNLGELPIRRAPGIKEYCSYWLRHGECDYAQQGCLYRHEMPLDRSTLEKLGFRDIPRWYRERHQLGSYLAGGNTISGISAGSTTKPSLVERNWRNQPAEDLLHGTSTKPDKGVELPTTCTSSLTEQRSDKPSTSQSLPRKPAISTPKPAESSPKPPYHSFSSRHQPSVTPTSKAKAKPSITEEETVSARQTRETIRMLDAYDQHERDRLAEKYQTLEPQKTSIPVPANTPSSSTASSTSGGVEGEEVTEEVVGVVKQGARFDKPSLVPTMMSPFPKTSSAPPAPGLKKRLGKAKRRGNSGKEVGRVGNGKARVHVERLVDDG